jgi:hypothetical protein
MHVDSSVYVTIAQGITRGYVPYRDFVDNKGPLAYLISVPGLYFGGFTGLWITEYIFMCVFVFFAFKTALFFGKFYMALFGTMLSCLALLAFSTVNAGTEEYSLPFLMISLYIFTKYFFSPEQKVHFHELLILGICFACAIMIRLNMFPLWAGFCLVIFVELVKNRHFALLGKYILGFCLGIIIVFIPVFLYLEVNGIINDFFEQVVFGGAARGFSTSSNGIKEISKNFYVVINRNLSVIPLAFGIFMAAIKFKQNSFTFYFGYTVSYLLMLLFLSFSIGGSHYNMVLIPFFVPALVFIAGSAYSLLSNSEIKTKKIMLVLFFFVIFSEGLLMFFYNATKIVHDESGKMLINAGKMIDENTKPGDKIISLGYNGYIYPFTKRDAASKYVYQGSGLNYIAGAEEKFISAILNTKPAIIAIFTAEDGDGSGQYMENWHKPIFELMEQEYRFLSGENGVKLFIRR